MKMGLGTLNIPPNIFWKMTIRELILKIEGEQERKEAEFERQKWLIWHQAALSKGKRMPSLKRFLRGVPNARELEGEELQERRDYHQNVSMDFEAYLLRKGVRK